MILQRLVLAAVLCAPLTASAADLPVSYLVEEKPLKAATAGTPLAFELYSDSACTTLVQSVPVNVENVTVLSKLKQMTPKGDTKLPNTVELRHTLVGVSPASVRYLKVTGTGVTPIGGGCQAQGPAVPVVPIVTDATGALLGTLYPDSNCGDQVALKSSSGIVLVSIARASGSGFGISCVGAVRFASADCSGPAVVNESNTYLAATRAPGVNGSAYVPSNVPSSSMPYNSLLFDSDAPSCAGAGRTFVPPFGCCCSPPACSAGSSPSVPVSEVLTFVPPFSVTFP